MHYIKNYCLKPGKLYLKKLLLRFKRKSGLPSGFSPENLNLFIPPLRYPVKKIMHDHLSSWKKEGSYRVTLIDESHQKHSYIFKNAIYRHDHIPALKGFPIKIGFSEFSLFSLSKKGLSLPFLPQIHYLNFRESKQWYQYVFEDLAENYKLLFSIPNYQKKLTYIASQIPLIQNQISQALKASPETEPILYNRSFNEGLCNYTLKTFETYNRAIYDPKIALLLQNWSDIESTYLHPCFLKSRPCGHVHGDLNPTNIYICYSDQKIKLIDWEWTGIGLPHQDLASLNPHPTQQKQHSLIEAFSKQYPSITPKDHEMWYDYALLERALINCSFLASQILETGSQKKWIIHFIHNASDQITSSHHRLLKKYVKIST